MGAVIQSQIEALKKWEQKIRENILFKEYVLRKIKREELQYEGKIKIFEQAGEIYKEDIEALKAAFDAMKDRNTRLVVELEREKILMEEALEEIHGKLDHLKREWASI
ncbi:putative nucleotide-binding protein (sugar kinase/HSP70/actin superfamily) [Anaerosolibacter carboniphilus]|uniref:Putative nucleotide-binding protein (Sugar kinase/HSP70/actin superfamily) n=1 Tax=Anaerosolibacter carboniphilus TaxID=1417629 RepID=A0A841KVJ4_9FIRM|nr:hypothetical protein [Anaerosolibacter carboniphilus]MBB6216238.1 putative nucleotide-binding protein (sugar kinase/HSP70/actin superfamily) [Anaerosolibacter carboniphilus]